MEIHPQTEYRGQRQQKDKEEGLKMIQKVRI